MSSCKDRASDAFFSHIASSVISLKVEEAVEGIIILYLLMTNKECIDDIALKEFGEQCPLSKLQELVMDREA